MEARELKLTIIFTSHANRDTCLVKKLNLSRTAQVVKGNTTKRKTKGTQALI